MEQEEVEGTGDVVHVRVHPDEDVHRNHFNKSEKYIKQKMSIGITSTSQKNT